MSQKGTTPTARKKAESQHPVAVQIYDQTYNLSGVDPDHVRALAATVDSKMRAVAARGSTVDSLRVAVLAALNLADEITLLRQRLESPAEPQSAPAPTLATRADALSSLLDQVLAEERAAG